MLHSAVILAQRDLIRFFRQRSRLIGAVGQPIVFWILFGSGLHATFDPPAWADPSVTYQQFFLPGIIALILLFTAIFSTISIIEDRNSGFLQGVLVAPISRQSIVLGKLLGGTLIAMIQAILFLLLGLVTAVLQGTSIPLAIASVPQFLLLIVVMILLAFALTGLGFLIAWPMESTQGFHAVMSIVLMPMWLVSGAFFPSPGEGWLSWLMAINPMSYGVTALQRLLLPVIETQSQPGFQSLTFCIGLTTLFAGACYGISTWQVSRASAKNVR